MSKGDVLETDDGRAIIKAWLNDSDADPSTYLTKEGMSYLNGFFQANNTIGLIKREKYDKLLKDYEDLISKYEILLKKDMSLLAKIKRLF